MHYLSLPEGPFCSCSGAFDCIKPFLNSWDYRCLDMHVSEHFKDSSSLLAKS